MISAYIRCDRQGLWFGLLDPTYDYPGIGEKLYKIILEERIIILEMQTATTNIKLP